ncbi:MAG: terminase [Herbinix sp.]|jgi:phage terminase large subunit-like protein|nr:terminase [Herbinix sp.]
MLLEKARQYAEDVIAGKERTTFEVKKQCLWFIRDLAKQEDESFKYYMDLGELQIIDGLLKLLNFATGINIIGKSVYEGLVPFQAFFLANVFGWRFKDDTKKYRYRDVTLFIPRKNAKTFICALIIIILMLKEDAYSEFYSICLDRDLAGEVKKAINQILTASPYVNKYFKIPKTLSGRVECLVTHSTYQPRTANANSNNSIRPSAFIADEVGAFKDHKNILAMRSGQLSVKNPLMFKLTTAYAEDKSIMLDELDYLKKIYKELEFDDRVFALLYYAEEKHLWDDIGLEMANPLRIKENYDEIRNNRKNALAKPSEREEYLTKHMNYFLPSNSGEEYISLDKLRLCKEKEPFDWKGRDVYIGLDLAMTNDNVSVSMCCFENDKIYAKSWAFIPGGRIEEKNRIERTDYNRFIREGSCFPCGDEVISYAYVENFIMTLEEKYGVKIIQVGYDRYNCLSTAGKLESAGYETVEVKQHSSVLHQPTKLLYEKILEKNFSYDGSKLYETNFQNAKCDYDTNKNRYVNKKKSNGKVDMVVSTIIAVYLLQQDILLDSDDDFAVQEG